jgi:Fe2+ transport system protein FeoA
LDLPLTKLKQGVTAIIISIYPHSGNPNPHNARKITPQGTKRHHHFQKRLEDMGLTPGTHIKVIRSAPFRGPIELAVRGSRLALGRGMADRILVRVKE